METLLWWARISSFVDINMDFMKKATIGGPWK
jgi:hypothetical protein